MISVSHGCEKPCEGPTPVALARKLSVSGIYPHLAVWNHGRDASSPWYRQPECGIGAVIPWAGRLWFLTYPSHALGPSDDKLYALSPDLVMEASPQSVGGTHACRMIHPESSQLFIGCYAIGMDGDVRVIDRAKLPGRLTAIARHLTDPRNKVYYYTQECSLYEVDVHTLEPTLLDIKPLPGWHAKGAYAAQGVLVVAHNGEEPGPSPFWEVDYADLAATVRGVERHLKVPATYGPDDLGALGEWDGADWRLVARRQHNDVMGPGGLTGAASADEPIWAMGWDRRSVLVNVRHEGQWTTYRLPKGSYTYDGWNGSYTEWPRFREVGDGRWLATMHGTFFEWSPRFRPGHAVGVRPLCTYQRYIPDFCRWGNHLVLAGQDASRIGVPWAAPAHPHSNLQFLTDDDLLTWGPRAGFGGVWRDDEVSPDAPSEPFLVAGYDMACLHLAHRLAEPVTFTIEGDAAGDGQWRELARVTAVPYAWHVLHPTDAGLTWIRIRAARAAVATAYLHLWSPRRTREGEAGKFRSLARAGSRVARTACVLHVPVHTHNLAVLWRAIDRNGCAGPEAYHEADESLTFHRVDTAPFAQAVRDEAAITQHVFEDAASLIVTNADGRRLRLPRASCLARETGGGRDVREVLQERSLANLGGTFYEVPRLGVPEPYEQRNLPDYSRMRPIASHGYTIDDFVVWRGMIVLGGVRADAQPDGHIFCVDDAAGPALWFGAIDDLWAMGKPVGVGGPWLDTPVRGGEPSDPYLMTGFDRKSLRMSHHSEMTVEFHIEVDVTGDGTFRVYATIDVPPKRCVEHEFPIGFHAHWVRLVPNRSTVATAELCYT